MRCSVTASADARQAAFRGKEASELSNRNAVEGGGARAFAAFLGPFVGRRAGVACPRYSTGATGML